MRLIDADKLKSYIDCGHLRPPTELCFSELDVCNMIDKAPTVSAEAVQGEWTNKDGKQITDKFSVYCSRCKRWSEYRTNYCGHCGAKMGGNNHD